MYTGKTRNMARLASLRALCAPLALTLSASLAVAAYFAPSATAADTLSGRAKQGAAIFQQRCVACHNKQPGDTSPFGPPNLNGIFKGPSSLTTKQAVTIIEKGKTPMPAFGTVLTRTDVDDLIAYLKTR
jgi:mono/diheme cytochrome c family protein